jgi:hypothetical protein
MKNILYTFAALMLGISLNAAEKTQAELHPLDDDYKIQGEYSGTIGGAKAGAQVIALGNGHFQAVIYTGGLPGDGWDKTNKSLLDGKTADGKTTFTAASGNRGYMHKNPAQFSASAKFPPDGHQTEGSGEIAGEKFTGKLAGKAIDMKKVERKSPTLGAKPPAGAVVLFDGTTAEHFNGGKIDGDGLLCQGVKSKEKFHDHLIHIEWRSPYKPTARSQGRGNSGFYAQGRYEVQMLDSFGLQGKMNEAGGIYSVGPPDQNMAFPPMTWQTYDLEVVSAKFDANGKKTDHAKLTVKHNGVVIHQDKVCDHSTTASPLKEGTDPGFVYLQNHGNPVRYRNIWVVKK